MKSKFICENFCKGSKRRGKEQAQPAEALAKAGGRQQAIGSRQWWWRGEGGEENLRFAICDLRFAEDGRRETEDGRLQDRKTARLQDRKTARLQDRMTARQRKRATATATPFSISKLSFITA